MNEIEKKTNGMEGETDEREVETDKREGETDRKKLTIVGVVYVMDIISGILNIFSSNRTIASKQLLQKDFRLK